MSQRVEDLQQLRKGDMNIIEKAREALFHGLSPWSNEIETSSSASFLSDLGSLEFTGFPSVIRTIGAIARYPTTKFLFAALLLRVTDPVVGQSTIDLFDADREDFPKLREVSRSFGSANLKEVLNLFGPNSVHQLYEVHLLEGTEVIRPTRELIEECRFSNSPVLALREQCLAGIQEIHQNSTLQPPEWLGPESLARYLEHFHYSYWRHLGHIKNVDELELRESIYNKVKTLLQEERAHTLISPLSTEYMQASWLVRQYSTTPYPQTSKDLRHVYSVSVAPTISVELTEHLSFESSVIEKAPLPDNLEENFTRVLEDLFEVQQKLKKKLSVWEEQAFFDQQVKILYQK